MREDAEIIPFPTVTPGGEAEPALPNVAADLRLRDVLGEVLREERLRQERTLADVAADAAVSLPYLSEVERGRKEVSSDLLHTITRALELELVEVLERAAERLRPGMQRNGPEIRMLAA